jgi:hypothetical protein
MGEMADMYDYGDIDMWESRDAWYTTRHECRQEEMLGDLMESINNEEEDE